MGSGQLFEPAAEHPFWVVGRGWTPVWELSIGDCLTTITGETVSVEGVHETNRRETVDNLRVSDFHTDFVGCDEWGFSVWAHNLCYQDWLTKHKLTHTSELEALFKSAETRTLTAESEKLLHQLISMKSTRVRGQAWKDLETVALENLPAGRALTENDLPLLKRYLSLPEGADGGRWGSLEVRKLNHAIAQQRENQGWKVTGGAGRASEEFIDVPKGIAYPDITLTKDGKTLRIQTATTENGKLEASEVVKANKIRAAFPNDERIIISKDTGLPVKFP
ncbi:polymorphic toxin-type HINT domain-containing protein [Tuwongella immobilis]|uniref:Intein C-terminal splicing domain-containing protein n=1 Tax=Tuwongella immobilis TaxID=692036 RepID=A0A6C2YHT8_9BACT|nr:polymorphic toxin-type HINT domain-containing protein [Tuwongella immobilis]VIP00829.1 YD repeat protein OS=Isosphaera pallida (strain ATCC 43644 / DSM 9630 / IS1B) GN=Isop_2419 PE=4 SV=1: PT-HINT [Tuwongella immobilis]VTR97076.1 YD repeat protein OS=Isosphaera pallida (strain ATCC 43644 / DSM 9630 / IS1B) GN=Isop_2419 PE=4 SV=1: PT-HINT [Tuwongella immobilis]